MSMPRDLGDDTQPQGPRRAGRVVPPEEPEVPAYIDLVVGGVSFGSIEPMTLKGRAQLDLERCMRSVTPVGDMLRWCRVYAGVSDTDLPMLEEELAEMSITAIVDLAAEISRAIGEAMTIPKARRRR